MKPEYSGSKEILLPGEDITKTYIEDPMVAEETALYEAESDRIIAAQGLGPNDIDLIIR